MFCAGGSPLDPGLAQQVRQHRHRPAGQDVPGGVFICLWEFARFAKRPMCSCRLHDTEGRYPVMLMMEAIFDTLATFNSFPSFAYSST